MNLSTVMDVALIAAIFTLAGLVKGVAGFGLPTVSLSLLVLTRSLPEAMALMLVPALATNIWQAVVGGAVGPVLRRIWPFLLAVLVCGYAATSVLARSDSAVLTGLLGLLMVASSALALLAPQFTMPSPATERWLSPVMGGLSGIVTGLTGSFLVPAAQWLAALRLPKQQFVQGFGMGVVAGMTALGAGLQGNGLLPAEIGLLSVAGLLPAFAGLEAGRRLRGLMPEVVFRRVVQWALGALGVFLAVRAFG